MTYGKHIARNTAWLAIAMALNKVIAFVTFAVVARLIGPYDTGVYFFAVSVTSVFVVLADLGMAPVIIREIAGGRDEGPRYLSAALRLKLLLVPFAVLLSLGYGVWSQADPITLMCVGIACAVMSADSFHLAFYASLRGKQNLKPEALGMLMGQIFTACIAIGGSYLGYGAPGLVTALLVGSLWNVGWSFLNARLVHIKLPAPLKGDYRKLFTEAMPFAISGIAVKVYSYTDSLLIKAMHGTEAVGMYAVAYKMTYALQFLPLTFSAALYPSLAQAWAKQDHARLRRSFLESLRITAAIGFPLSAGLSALAPRLIPAIYGHAFLGAVAPYQVLPWVLLPIFMDFPVGALLNATGRAKLKTMAMLGTMVINVILNVILVPSMGPLGAAWAGVFSFWSLYFMGITLTRNDVGGYGPALSILGRSLCAGIVTWIAIRTVGGIMPLIPTAIFGGATAVGLAYATRLVRMDDLTFLLRLRKTDTDESEEEIHV